MSNGTAVIISLVSILLLLMTSVVITIVVVLRKHLPAVKCFFLNLADGIERNRVQIDELKSVLTEYHAGLEAAVSSCERETMNQFQGLCTKLDAESAEREKADSAVRTAIIDAVEKAKAEFAANSEQSRSTILNRFDAESAEREKANSAARTAIIDAVEKAKAEFAANSEQSRSTILNRFDAESAEREKANSAARTAIIDAVEKAKAEFAANLEQSRSTILNRFDAESAEREKADSAARTEIIDAVEKAKAEFAANSEQSRSTLMNKIDSVQEWISAKFNQLDYIFDQCKTTGEILSRVETHLNSKLSELTEKQTQIRDSEKDNFLHWREAFELQKVALDSLKSELTKLKDQEAQGTNANRLLLVETQNKLEARLYGIQSSVMLLNSGVDNAPPQEKIEKKKTASSKESRSEIQRADFIPLPGEKTDFETLPDGKTISRTYRDGKLIFEITLNRYGVPEKGTMFSASGKTIREFNYGPDGQVK